MTAYEFYRLDPVKGFELIGILPERRKNASRINQKSVMHWVEKVFNNKLSTKDTYFIKVMIDEYTGKIFRPTPVFLTQQKVKIKSIFAINGDMNEKFSG
jgi:hypothetical protein